MQQLAAFRPHVIAGVAVLGAGLIAVTPAVSDHVQCTFQQRALALAGASEGGAVDLTGAAMASATQFANASVNPVQAWIDVFTNSFNNVSTIANEWLADPFPVLQQVVANQAGYANTVATAVQDSFTSLSNFVTGSAPDDLRGLLSEAWTFLQAGNIEGVVSIFNEIVFDKLLEGTLISFFPVVEIPATMSQNFANAVAALTDVTTLEALYEASVGPLINTTTAFGDSLQGFVSFLHDGDPITALTYLVNMPAAVTDGFLNGITEQFPPGAIPGFLSDNGPIGTLLITIPEAIARAIAPASTSKVADFVTGGSVMAGLSTDLLNAADLSSLAGLSILPADIASIVGSLGADLASVFDPAALLGMLPF